MRVAEGEVGIQSGRICAVGAAIESHPKRHRTLNEEALMGPWLPLRLPGPNTRTDHFGAAPSAFRGG